MGAAAILRTGRRGAGAAAAAAILVGLATGAAPARIPDAAVAEARESVLAQSRLQTELPGPGAGAAPSAGPPPEPLVPPADPGQPPRLEWAAELSEILIWVAVAVVLGYLLALLVSGLGGRPRRRDARSAATDAPAREPEPSPPPPAADPDPAAAAMRLADAGRRLEAVRLLLRAAVDLLTARGRDVRAASTGREIHRGLGSEPGLAESFGAMVAAVERALFRGEAVERGDVERCAASFAAFRDALAGDGR